MRDLPAVMLQLVTEKRHSHGIVVVVDKQLRYENYIVPALMINNIAVFT